jgi:uncharacterized protein (DUF433 family)
LIIAANAVWVDPISVILRMTWQVGGAVGGAAAQQRIAPLCRGEAISEGDHWVPQLNGPDAGTRMVVEDLSEGWSREFSNPGGAERMQLCLTTEDLEYLHEVANRKVRPTNRQKAQALLGLAFGDTPETVSQRVGIRKEDLASLVSTFREQGLEGIGLVRSGQRGAGRSQRRRTATIEKNPGVCGGTARITGTWIPVWQLVEARSLGASEAQLLIDYPRLTAANLVDAWAYAKDHPEEIAAQIHQNEVA